MDRYFQQNKYIPSFLLSKSSHLSHFDFNFNIFPCPFHEGFVTNAEK